MIDRLPFSMLILDSVNPIYQQINLTSNCGYFNVSKQSIGEDMSGISFNLSGNKALITGANRGIGFGIAKGMAEAGASVAIIGRDKAKNKEALEELKKIDPEAKAYVVDLENLNAIDSAYREIINDFGAIDILVNNAGVTCRERADKLTIEEFERVMTINHSAQFALSTAYARERMASEKGGSIVMIGSLM